MLEQTSLILASGSAARRSMLSAAGLSFDVIPADIDEEAIKSALVSTDPYADPARIATQLACEKARAVARSNPGKIVIGSDQVLVFENTIYAKAATKMEARAVLKKLRGRTHELISAVAIARDGELLWNTTDSAKLTMREFTDAFLANYLETAGGILNCVGCYQIEGPGIQMFEKIDGDFFTILGMPLLPLLGALRKQGQVML